MSITDSNKRNGEDCDVYKIGSEIVTLEEFVNFMRNDENNKKGLAKEAAIKESLFNNNEQFESNHMLIKVIDKLMECMFMDDCEDQYETAFLYVYAAAEYYEKRGYGKKWLNINNLLSEDLYAITVHASSEHFKMYH